MRETPTPLTIIRQAREERGWTQGDLAERLQVSETTVRAWEAGRNTPSLPIRHRIEELLEISLQQGTNGQETRNVDPKPKVFPSLETRPSRSAERNREHMLKRVGVDPILEGTRTWKLG